MPAIIPKQIPQAPEDKTMTNEQLAALDAAATQGVWAIGNNVGVLFGPDVQIAKFGDFFDKELVPLNGGRWNADAQLCATLINLYRAGQLVVRTEPSEADVERVARAVAASDWLDYDEVCGVDADPDEGYCDSGTCVAAHHEDHEAEFAREWYCKLARTAIAAMVR